MNADPNLPNPDESRPEIADAGALFRDGETSRPVAKPAPTRSDDPYELRDAPIENTRPSPPPVAFEAPAPPEPPVARRAPARLEPSDAVEEVWSRMAEWGGTIGLLSAVGFGGLFLLYLFFQFEFYSLAFLGLLALGLVLTVLSYPILITLERPVRVTPEQAARDFYTALSHHRPHYRRMWLLLSTRGKVSGAYASFEGFRSYWEKMLEELRAGKASSWTPLKFQVDDFKSEKSAGQTEIEGKFVVNVFIRGQQDAGPVTSVRMKSTFVKGPDRMWYLERGTL